MALTGPRSLRQSPLRPSSLTRPNHYTSAARPPHRQSSSLSKKPVQTVGLYSQLDAVPSLDTLVNSLQKDGQLFGGNHPTGEISLGEISWGVNWIIYWLIIFTSQACWLRASVGSHHLRSLMPPSCSSIHACIYSCPLATSIDTSYFSTFYHFFQAFTDTHRRCPGVKDYLVPLSPYKSV